MESPSGDVLVLRGGENVSTDASELLPFTSSVDHEKQEKADFGGVGKRTPPPPKNRVLSREVLIVIYCAYEREADLSRVETTRRVIALGRLCRNLRPLPSLWALALCHKRCLQGLPHRARLNDLDPFWPAFSFTDNLRRNGCFESEFLSLT